MNREKFINKFDKDTGYFVNNPNNALHLARYNFILLIEKAELIQKENTRLKKQLANNHHTGNKLSPHGTPTEWRETYSIQEQNRWADMYYNKFLEQI